MNARQKSEIKSKEATVVISLIQTIPRYILEKEESYPLITQLAENWKIQLDTPTMDQTGNTQNLVSKNVRLV